MSKWVKVVFADDCGEPWCKACEAHYSDCECPGPTQDDEFEYRERKGILEARKL